MELPSKKVKAERINPKTMIIFSQPKMGKTTVLSGLDNCLILDLEKGTHFVDALKVDVITEAEKNNEIPITILKQIIDQIAEKNNENKGYVYKYIAIDTVTALEAIVLPLANKMYKETPMGRNWVGDDVTTLPNGAGYRFTRLALSTVINQIERVCDTLIILGHVKDKLVEKDGKEMNERGLDLTGKMPAILCSKVDAIGYLYRHENDTVINFAPSEALLCGSRSEHLKNKEIVVASSDESGKISIDWSTIFLTK
jgi:hypothetical protein|tara:strand:- start:471 stop:1235 length:765 start_codon:yes stop_codon:yes gene_type:complete